MSTTGMISAGRIRTRCPRGPSGSGSTPSARRQPRLHPGDRGRRDQGHGRLHASAVTQSIAAAPRPALLPATAKWTPTHVEITATAPADADVLVAVWEAERAVKVTRGENAGETLSNARIVRRLERVAAAGKQGVLKIELDRAWRSVGAVAFAQRSDKRIVASVVLR
ncbi:MAG: DUF1223 domain-containing protein [Kofleriaceae bacterium]